MTTLARPQEILKPVTAGLIAITLFGALLINLVPLSPHVTAMRPDCCALVLIYWGIHQPRKVGFSVAFLLGMAIDLANASLFGQNALTYVTMLYAAIAMHRRILNFSLIGQSLHIAPLLLVGDLIALAVRLLAGAEMPPATYFVGTAIGTLLWAPLSALLRLPRLPKAGVDLV